MYNQAQKKATMGWEKRNYEQIKFTAPKGFKERLKNASAQAGMSMRGYIISTLEKEVGEKVYWVNFILGGERPYFLSHSKPYPTLEKANDSVKKMVESYDVILSYVQEQDIKTGKLTPIIVTPHINSMGAKK